MPHRIVVRANYIFSVTYRTVLEGAQVPVNGPSASQLLVCRL